jgi:D-alanyl-D-alanine carboxypeptidase
MRHLSIIACFITALLITSCKADIKQKDDYSIKIDSIIKIGTPRTFNGVAFIQQNGKEKYAKAFEYSDFNKKKKY